MLEFRREKNLKVNLLNRDNQPYHPKGRPRLTRSTNWKRIKEVTKYQTYLKTSNDDNALQIRDLDSLVMAHIGQHSSDL